jgi:ubiquinone/menaquinone biosynthesis C-methylase UbiE
MFRRFIGGIRMRKMAGQEFDELVTFFDNMAQTKWLSALHSRLIQLTGNWSNKDVLDVGSGTGRLLLHGASEANSVSGIDISEKMVNESNRLYDEKALGYKAKFQVGDAYHLPFESELFDIALSTCVMFLLPEPEKGLKEIIRVTKKGGVLAFLNPSYLMDVERATIYAKEHKLKGFEQETLLRWSNISTKRHRYTSDQFHLLLKDCGLSEVKSEAHLDGLALITVGKK